MFCSFAFRSNYTDLASWQIATMATPPELTAMLEETTATSAVEVVEDTVTAMTETLAVPAMPLPPPMVIQLLVQSLGNLMVAATLMRDTPAETTDC